MITRLIWTPDVLCPQKGNIHTLPLSLSLSLSLYIYLFIYLSIYLSLSFYVLLVTWQSIADDITNVLHALQFLPKHVESDI